MAREHAGWAATWAARRDAADRAGRSARWAGLPQELLATILCMRLDADLEGAVTTTAATICSLRLVSRDVRAIVDRFVGAQLATLVDAFRGRVLVKQSPPALGAPPEAEPAARAGPRVALVWRAPASRGPGAKRRASTRRGRPARRSGAVAIRARVVAAVPRSRARLARLPASTRAPRSARRWARRRNDAVARTEWRFCRPVRVDARNQPQGQPLALCGRRVGPSAPAQSRVRRGAPCRARGAARGDERWWRGGVVSERPARDKARRDSRRDSEEVGSEGAGVRAWRFLA